MVSRTVEITFVGDTAQVEKAFRGVSAAAGKLGKDLEQTSVSSAKAGQGIASIGKGEPPLKRLSGTASTLGLGMGGVAGGAALAGTAVVAFAKDAIQSAATFDTTMRQVAAATNTPASQLGELRDLALEMGAKTKFSAQEAGQAMLELAKGGLSAAQIQAGGLEATLTLAAAGGLELGDAATFMSNALNTFGLEASDAGAVAAALAGGANASTASVESLGQALSQVGPGAKNAGLSLQETVAALAAFDSAGIKGSDAGTSLKTMLVSLVPQTDKAKEAMEQLGLKFTDASGNILPLTQVAEQLRLKLSGLTQEQKIAALATIFGSDATRAATVLMAEGADGIQRYIDATNDKGAAEAMAKTNTEGAAGAMEQLGGAIETLKISLGTTLLPIIEKAADAASFLTSAFTELNDRTDGVAATFAFLGPVVGGVHGLWSNLKAVLPGVASEQDKVTQATQHSGEAAKTTTVEQQKLKVAQDQGAASSAGFSQKQDEAAQALQKVATEATKAIGLFDGYKNQSNVTSAQILKNLQTERAAFATWSTDVQSLIKKGVDPKAIQDLSVKGPQYVHAMATASDKELALFVKLYQQRNQEAAKTQNTILTTGGTTAGRNAANATIAGFGHPILTATIRYNDPLGGGYVPGGPVRRFQHGGVIRNPVVGIDTRTGQRIMIGERGPEAVVPLSGGQRYGGPTDPWSRAGGGTIHVGQIVVQGASDPEQTALKVREVLLRLQARNGTTGIR